MIDARLSVHRPSTENSAPYLLDAKDFRGVCCKAAPTLAKAARDDTSHMATAAVAGHRIGTISYFMFRCRRSGIRGPRSRTLHSPVRRASGRDRDRLSPSSGRCRRRVISPEPVSPASNAARSCCTCCQQAAVGEIIGQRLPAVAETDNTKVGNFLCALTLLPPLLKEEYLAADLGRADLMVNLAPSVKSNGAASLAVGISSPLAASGDHLTVMVARIAAPACRGFPTTLYSVFSASLVLESEVRGSPGSRIRRQASSPGSGPPAMGSYCIQWFGQRRRRS